MGRKRMYKNDREKWRTWYWSDVEEHRKYFRDYMRRYRARRKLQSQKGVIVT